MVCTVWLSEMFPVYTPQHAAACRASVRCPYEFRVGEKTFYNHNMKRRRCERRLAADEPRAQLHTDGYTVVRGVLPVDAEQHAAMVRYARDHGRAIFNHRDDRQRTDGGHGRNDLRRRQCTVSGRRAPKPLLSVLKAAESAMAERGWSHGRTLSPWALLRSLPGCQRQAAHADYVPSAQLVAAADDDMPLAVLVALQNGTTLDVWPRSIRLIGADAQQVREHACIRRRTVQLDAGDVLAFRGDLVHAGSAYDTENVRLHVYLDTTSVPRQPNRTWLIDVDGNEELRRVCA